MDYFKLIDKWMDYNELKSSYVFASESFDKKEFVLLVKETSLAIRGFRTMIFDFDNNVQAIKNTIFDFSQVIAELAKYSTDFCADDESDDYIFSASQMVVRLLLLYATSPCKVIPTDETGVLYGNNEDCGIFCPSVADKNSAYWTQTFEYDPETGDLSKLIELVKTEREVRPF